MGENYLDRRAEMYTKLRKESDGHARMTRIDALFRLSNESVIVRHFLDAWKSGQAISFESMLVDLAIEQALCIERLTRHLTLCQPLTPPQQVRKESVTHE